jgi:hypothetical protein
VRWGGVGGGEGTGQEEFGFFMVGKPLLENSAAWAGFCGQDIGHTIKIT